MCRGGKDGVIRRCQLDDRKHASVNFRKKVKYRADKAGLSVEEWKRQNPVETESLIKETFPVMPDNSIVEFQDISEVRTLPEGVPENIEDHVRISKEHMDSKLTALQKKAMMGYTSFAAGICNVVLRKEDAFPEGILYDGAPLWKEPSLSAPTDFSSKEDLQDYMETIDSVLAERQEATRVLYRGHPIYESMREELAAEIGEEWIDDEDTELLMKALASRYPVGSVTHHPSYLSTSLSAFQAADRTQEVQYRDRSKIRGVMFEMKTNAGFDITGVSSHEYEREVVLPRDVNFRIDSIKLQPESYNTVSGFDDKYEPSERSGKNFDNLAIVIQMVEVDKNGNEITHTNNHEPKPLNFA